MGDGLEVRRSASLCSIEHGTRGVVGTRWRRRNAHIISHTVTHKYLHKPNYTNQRKKLCKIFVKEKMLKHLFIKKKVGKR